LRRFRICAILSFRAKVAATLAIIFILLVFHVICFVGVVGAAIAIGFLLLVIAAFLGTFWRLK
jgi:hypothetical protein